MEQENLENQMSWTNKKEKIFNVRKVHYKQFDNEKYLKPTFSPFQLKEHIDQPLSTKINKKGGEYNYQVGIISSQAYKELTKKYNGLKQEFGRERQTRLEELIIKEEELNKCKSEKERIDTERIKIIQRRDQLRYKIEQIRYKNQLLKAEKMQRHEEYRIMNMEYLRNMVMGVRYQNGQDIDLDSMTYEELLQLQEKMGSVSKGLTSEQIEKLPTKVYKSNQPEQLCSICYQNAKDGQEITILGCKHSFHSECIKQWLVKQKMCPMCKQEIITKIQSNKKLMIEHSSEKDESQVQGNSIQSILRSQNMIQSQEQEMEDNQNQENASQTLLPLSGHA